MHLIRTRLARALVVLALAVAAMPVASASPIPYPPQLWLIDADGSNPRAEVGDFFNSYLGFSWSPSGNEFAYGNHEGVHIRNLDTNEDRLIVRIDENPSDIAWSPDGAWIIYKFMEGDGFSGFRIVSPDGQTKRTIYQDQDAILSGADWSPASDRIVFARGVFPGESAELYVLDIPANVATVLMGTHSLYITPRWSPNGEWIAFTEWPRTVAVIRPNGTDIKRLSPQEESADSPAWSPDGSRLAFSAESGLYVTSPETGTLEVLAERGNHPDWSPSGTEIAFVAGESDLYVVDVVTKDTRQLTDDIRRSEANPQWSPDGTTIAFVSTQQHIMCPGFPYGPEASIWGTNGDDHLRGTPGRDVIAGLGGNDTVTGMGGDDIVCGGPGTDVVTGGRGADVLYGERGDDEVRGGRGRDTLDGGSPFEDRGRDSLFGGPGIDSCRNGETHRSCEERPRSRH